MEKLPMDLWLKIFYLLDHQNLATALQVCRKWNAWASDNILWSNLYEERWGRDLADAPLDSKTWKDVYEVQDRCDRIGLGLKIIREGGDYYLVHQGEIQRHLGSKRKQTETNGSLHCSEDDFIGEGYLGEESTSGILDKILFFIGDLEATSVHAKRAQEE
ncbi:hypothetical protein NMG60_11020102 [Bertholletia excelsa]